MMLKGRIRKDSPFLVFTPTRETKPSFLIRLQRQRRGQSRSSQCSAGALVTREEEVNQASEYAEHHDKDDSDNTIILA